MSHTECVKLFDAGKAAIGQSSLANWAGGAFHPCGCESDFENYREEHFHPKFGRYMAWVLFSVGAENIAKSAFSCSEELDLKVTDLGYSRLPQGNLSQWLQAVTNPKPKPLAGIGKVTSGNAMKLDFGTLGWHLSEQNGMKGDEPKASTFCRLLKKHKQISDDDGRLLIAGFHRLTHAIRNRDGHTFVEGKRHSDFPLVEYPFVPAFNVLVATMKENGHWGDS